METERVHCEDCKYWTGSGGIVFRDTSKLPVWDCRFNPPSLPTKRNESRWPQTARNEWCSKGEKKEA